MRKVNYKSKEILEVVWDDTATKSGWQSKSTLQKESPARCRTVGYFCKQNKNCFTVAKSIVDDDEDEDGLDAQTIPNGCIKKIRRIRPS